MSYLELDIAYFTQVDYSTFDKRIQYRSSGQPDMDFVDTIQDIYDIFAKPEGIDTCISHHSSPGKIFVSALFVSQTPSADDVIKKMTFKQEDKGDKYRQYIVLGETSMRGRGDISLFDGVHVSKYHSQYTRTEIEWLLTNTDIKIFTKIEKIDYFYNQIIDYITQMPNSRDILLPMLMESLDTVRNWLNLEEPIRTRNNHFNPCVTSLREILKVKPTEVVLDSLRGFVRVCNNHAGVRFAFAEIERGPLEIENSIRLTTKNKSKSYIKPIIADPITDVLRAYLDNNQRQLHHIDVISGSLLVVIVTALAFITQSYEHGPSLLVNTLFWLSVGYKFVVLVILGSIFLNSGKGKAYDSSVAKHADPDSFKENELGKPEYQKYYNGRGEDFAHRVSEMSKGFRRPTINRADTPLADQVTSIAFVLQDHRDRFQWAFGLFILAALLYFVWLFLSGQVDLVDEVIRGLQNNIIELLPSQINFSFEAVIRFLYEKFISPIIEWYRNL